MTILFDLLDLDYDYSKGVGKFALKPLDVRNIKKVIKGWHNNIGKGYIINHI